MQTLHPTYSPTKSTRSCLIIVLFKLKIELSKNLTYSEKKLFEINNTVINIGILSPTTYNTCDHGIYWTLFKLFQVVNW